MNKLLFLLPLLSACASVRVPEPVDPIEANTVPQKIVSGSYAGVSWKCMQDTFNERLVWDRCEFDNTPSSNANVCINLYYVNYDGTYVETNRNVCSGQLAPHGSNTNYAAFVKQNRMQLARVCGHNLTNCEMLSLPVP